MSFRLIGTSLSLRGLPNKDRFLPAVFTSFKVSNLSEFSRPVSLLLPLSARRGCWLATVSVTSSHYEGGASYNIGTTLGTMGVAALLVAALSERRDYQQCEALQDVETVQTQNEIVDNAVSKVLSRLTSLLISCKNAPHELRDRKVHGGVQVYALVKGSELETAHRMNDGALPSVRIASGIINASVQDVAICWWQVSDRGKKWDGMNTEISQVISTWPDRRLVYLQSKPKHYGIIASRDFAFWMCKVNPSKIPGFHTSGSVMFVQVNRPNDVPLNSPSIRGDVNSVLLLEPDGPKSTKFFYVIEINANGRIPTRAVESTADSVPLALLEMKKYLEGQSQEGIGAPPTDDLRDFGNVSVLHNVMTSREELKKAEEVLNRSLAKTKEGERRRKVDLTRQKTQLQEDLKQDILSGIYAIHSGD